MGNYQIFTDATADLTEADLKGLPYVGIIPMKVEIGGRDYTYGPGGELSAEAFYGLQKANPSARTSVINPQEYCDYFEPCLQNGQDILYLCFSSGLSGTIMSARMCIEDLEKKYPARKIICVDTLCASIGEGFLVREAAGKQAEGLSIDELSQWVTENRLRVCHWFTVDTFDYLRRGGRVSAAVAGAGTILKIRPLFRVDDYGKLTVTNKIRGSRKALERLVEKLEQRWEPDLGKQILIGHGDCPEKAELLRQEISSRIPDAETAVVNIGPIIGAHTGPGVVGAVCWGKDR